LSGGRLGDPLAPSGRDATRGSHHGLLRLADELERTMTNIRLGFRTLLKTPLVPGVAVVPLACLGP